MLDLLLHHWHSFDGLDCCTEHANENDVVAEQAISKACQEGFLVKTQDGLGVAFIHDTVQTAAYSLLEKASLSSHHLKLGRMLQQYLDPNQFQKHLLTIANQFARGHELITKKEDQIDAARIFLQAGDKYKVATAFPEAQFFFMKSIQMLCDEDWAQRYRLCYDVYMKAAEVAMITGDYKHMEEWLGIIFEHSKDSIDDQFRAYYIQVRSMVSRNDIESAVDLGVEALKLVGENFPTKHLTAHILVSYALSCFEYRLYYLVTCLINTTGLPSNIDCL